MPSFTTHIAWRYLRGKKGHNAIHVVTGISAVAIGVVTAAMVCVLSVMNGFGQVVEAMFSRFDPELRINRVDEGAFRAFDWVDWSGVEAVSGVAEGQVLVEYKDHTLPAQVMGVDSLFDAVTGIRDVVVEGEYCVWDGGFERCVMGQGLANQLGVGARFIGAVHLYAPRKHGRINILRPEESLVRRTVFMAAEFAVNQAKYDDALVLVGLDVAQDLLGCAPDQVTAQMVRLEAGADLDRVKRELAQRLGSDYVVADRYEQQADFFRIMSVEKLLTGLLLVFILLIASFNLIGSLTMLIIDKREDTRVLTMLGMSGAQIRRLFRTEGLLLSLLGAAGGLISGLAICLIQEHFGVLKLGNGTNYIISAYPVHVEWPDLLLIMGVVLLISYLASWVASRENIART